MATTLPFDAANGFAGWIQWLASATDGWFFVLLLGVIFLVSFIPMLVKWGMDSSLMASSFGVMLLAIPLYYLKGIEEGVLFFFIVVFVLSIIKFTIFKDKF